MRILVVDDDVPSREALVDALHVQGYQLAVANDGQQALEMLDAWAPELIISDLRMPRIDGLELLRRVRARLPALPFVLLTAHGTSQTQASAEQLGVVGYLEKPVALLELFAAIERALAGR